MRRRAIAAWTLSGNFLNRSVWARLAWLLGFIRTGHQLTFAWPEPVEQAAGAPLGPRVAVFVHFDAAGAVRPYVRRYLRQLREAGLEVVLVSNSGKLRPEALGQLKLLCRAVMIRRNVGYDFGAYRDALACLGLPRADTELIVLVNDSVYGPLRELDGILSRIDFDEADVWGLTESWQTRFHLQSYFVAVGPAAMRSPAWAGFWARVRLVPSKHRVIKDYEVGLSQALLKGGLRCKALWPYPDLARDVDESLFFKPGRNEPEILDPAIQHRRNHARHIRTAVMQRVPLNPTSDLWRQLLDAGFPFIKRELLRTNPTGVADVADWRAKLAAMQAETDDIEADLQRSLRGRSP